MRKHHALQYPRYKPYAEKWEICFHTTVAIYLVRHILVDTGIGKRDINSYFLIPFNAETQCIHVSSAMG
jgi:hypothetical protein